MGDIINAVSDVFGFGPASKQADAANNAAQAGLTASREATALQKQMYDQTRTDQTPWRNAGTNALAQMNWGMGLPSGGDSGATPFQGQGQQGSLMQKFGASDFQQDPGYSFRLSEGMKGLERSAAARGGLLSGAALKGITRYNQDMGSQEYQNAYNRFNSDQSTQYNRLAAMAGLGQTANGVNAAAGQNYANQAGNNMMTNGANQGNAALMAGNARASSYNNLGSAINTGMNYNWSSLFGNSNALADPTSIPMQLGGG
jgi:hypothetical protein